MLCCVTLPISFIITTTTTYLIASLPSIDN